MTAKVHHHPAYDDGSASEGPHGDKANGRVLDVEVVVNCEEDRKTGDGEGDAEANEGGPKP